MTIILIGYMGSGKSTIGLELAKVLKLDFLDLDTYILNKEEKAIPDLFKTKGEIYFRKVERVCLEEVLTIENTIVSLGGGTPCYGNNMSLIKDSKNIRSIYFKASIPNLVERLYDEKSTRPLIAHLKSKDELAEFIGKHLFERSFFYNQADTTISVDGKSVKAIVEDIVMELF